ncbi:DUF504 domain-containing protein [Thermopolyspora sp. NPDC052614]|uniref:DUF504 domain-containing protein n=1 Tax=Thermopolyspora sp. NPDC052614 TaxID=3155682 RepID=UPI00343FCB96
MRTSEEIYHRVRWDPRFDPARFVFGVDQRGAEPVRGLRSRGRHSAASGAFRRGRRSGGLGPGLGHRPNRLAGGRTCA